jgi:outer membrane protein assembly factor BamB
MIRPHPLLRRARPARLSISGLLIAGLVVVAGAAPPAAAARPAGQVDWPMFHRDPAHKGVSTETTITAGNVSDLGLRWQANTGSPAFTSPAVVYNAARNKVLVYVANQDGTFAAYDAATGDRLWYYKVPAHLQSSPAVYKGTVYFGASDYKLYALNATTGALQCTFFTGGAIAASPVVVDPDGAGPQGRTVYFGDNGLTGTDDGGHIWAVHGVDPNDSFTNCTKAWSFNGFGDPPGSESAAGSWSPPAFGTDGDGRGIIAVGGSSPDNAVYGLDALTGARIWRYETQTFTMDNDVGAGPTLSAPGVNGFANGVAYVAGKNRIVYAINLKTGNLIWQFSIRDDSPGAGGATRSTASLLGNKLFIGYGAGVYALNATTGAKIWKTEQSAGISTMEVISSPAVTGPAKRRVLFVGDLGGTVYAFDLQNGNDLWSYRTDGFIYGSPVVSAGRVYIASSDAFLYAFGLGGGAPSAPPQTTLTEPDDGSTLPNPGGSLSLAGSASDDVGVRKVFVAIKDRNSTKWWDGATQSWSSVFQQNEAALADPGSGSTAWTYSVPLPPQGGVYFAQAEAIDADGQHDVSVAQADFTVSSSGNPPETTISVPTFKQVFTFPGGSRQSFPVTIRGTATDTSGANRGIDTVYLYVKNREHGEYFCGAGGCPAQGGEVSDWSPTYRKLEAVLDDPGQASTTWSYTFPTYDHPHSYFVAAWAEDLNGEIDQTRAQVQRFCIRDPGDLTCF